LRSPECSCSRADPNCWEPARALAGQGVEIVKGDLDDDATHFENKRRIEETVPSLRFPSHVILRPVFVMESLLAAFSLQGDTLSSAWVPTTKLQMIAVDDIGWSDTMRTSRVWNRSSAVRSPRSPTGLSGTREPRERSGSPCRSASTVSPPHSTNRAAP
jgi:hypothetical protein